MGTQGHTGTRTDHGDTWEVEGTRGRRSLCVAVLALGTPGPSWAITVALGTLNFPMGTQHPPTPPALHGRGGFGDTRNPHGDMEET